MSNIDIPHYIPSIEPPKIKILDGRYEVYRNKNNEFICAVPRLQVGDDILENQILKLLKPQLSIPDMTHILETGEDINTVFMISSNDEPKKFDPRYRNQFIKYVDTPELYFDEELGWKNMLKPVSWYWKFWLETAISGFFPEPILFEEVGIVDGREFWILGVPSVYQVKNEYFKNESNRLKMDIDSYKNWIEQTMNFGEGSTNEMNLLNKKQLIKTPEYNDFLNKFMKNLINFSYYQSNVNSQRVFKPYDFLIFHKNEDGSFPTNNFINQEIRTLRDININHIGLINNIKLKINNFLQSVFSVIPDYLNIYNIYPDVRNEGYFYFQTRYIKIKGKSSIFLTETERRHEIESIIMDLENYDNFYQTAQFEINCQVNEFETILPVWRKYMVQRIFQFHQYLTQNNIFKLPFLVKRSLETCPEKEMIKLYENIIMPYRDELVEGVKKGQLIDNQLIFNLEKAIFDLNIESYYENSKKLLNIFSLSGCLNPRLLPSANIPIKINVYDGLLNSFSSLINMGLKMARLKKMSISNLYSSLDWNDKTNNFYKTYNNLLILFGLGINFSLSSIITLGLIAEVSYSYFKKVDFFINSLLDLQFDNNFQTFIKNCNRVLITKIRFLNLFKLPDFEIEDNSIELLNRIKSVFPTSNYQNYEIYIERVFSLLPFELIDISVFFNNLIFNKIWTQYSINLFKTGSFEILAEGEDIYKNQYFCGIVNNQLFLMKHKYLYNMNSISNLFNNSKIEIIDFNIPDFFKKGVLNERNDYTIQVLTPNMVSLIGNLGSFFIKIWKNMTFYFDITTLTASINKDDFNSVFRSNLFSQNERLTTGEINPMSFYSKFYFNIIFNEDVFHKKALSLFKNIHYLYFRFLNFSFLFIIDVGWIKKANIFKYLINTEDFEYLFKNFHYTAWFIPNELSETVFQIYVESRNPIEVINQNELLKQNISGINQSGELQFLELSQLFQEYTSKKRDGIQFFDYSSIENFKDEMIIINNISNYFIKNTLYKSFNIKPNQLSKLKLLGIFDFIHELLLPVQNYIHFHFVYEGGQFLLEKNKEATQQVFTTKNTINLLKNYDSNKYCIPKVFSNLKPMLLFYYYNQKS